MNKQNLLQGGLTGSTIVTGVTIIRYITSRRHVFQAITIALFMLAAPAAAHASVSGGEIGAGRLLPTAAAVAGLTGVVIGSLALSRFRRAGNTRARAIIAGVLGLISILIGVLHAANSAGGFGTGNGLAGAVVAIGLGLIGMILGGRALARSRRIPKGSGTSATRYIVNNVDSSVAFYTNLLGFEVIAHPGPGFAMLSSGNLRLLLNKPGGGGGAGQAMPDGDVPSPGGWNRIQIAVDDLEQKIKDLKGKGARFRNELVIGNGGKQILLQDPSGNLIELFEPNR